MNSEDIKHKIYQQNGLASGKERRLTLVEKMTELNSMGKDCSRCSGMCCTYAYNSMQMTPLEAVELYFELESQGRLSEELTEALRKCVEEYRLDKELITGRGTTLRRTYTCPFFKPGAKGCSISRFAKPYGCLGFNPEEVGVSQEGHCKVYVDAHKEREKKFEEEEKVINEILQKDLGLYWKKLPIPVALLELIKRVGK